MSDSAMRKRRPTQPWAPGHMLYRKHSPDIIKRQSAEIFQNCRTNT